jgi:acyl transferase domain-containing protein/phosphopantetheinyl transferase
MRTHRPLDIAIVGMACRFPGARDLVAFWENILAGRAAIGDVPPERWDPADFLEIAPGAYHRVVSSRGGFLAEPITFDPAAHGIMPLTVEGGEPEAYLVLDAARAAMADAGLEGGFPDGRRVEVVIGRGNYFNRGNLTRLQHGRIIAQTLAILRAVHPEWDEGELKAIRAELKQSLPPFGSATVPGQLTNATAGLVANRLNLGGASLVVDAASASALVALDLGARAVAERRADWAVVGAVYLEADIDFRMVFSQLGALSCSGRIQPFSRDADGTLPGEGVGVVILRRLADAERAGDRVYAVLKGVGLASDGRGHGLAAPSARGHARALRRAYRRAGIDPATVGLIEGHGLGVPAADRAELKALRAVFPPKPRGRRVLGAVSSMIGHAMPAAGMAGLITTALALHHRVLPPTVHAGAPHPLLADEQSPFALNRSARPWIQGEPWPRRAGVNAFGFAGINAHAVLEEHAHSAEGLTPGCLWHWESECILLGAPDRSTWLELARALTDWLDHEPDAALKDLAATLNIGQPAYPFRVGLVASSLADLCERLSLVAAKLADPSCRSIRDARGAYFWEEPLANSGTLAFLFPGEGSQYPGMLADMCIHFPEVRAYFDTSDRVAWERGHARLPSEHLFGGPDNEDPNLWSIETAINVVLSAQWALYQVLLRIGVRPDAVAGHSSGEWLALGAAGVLRFDHWFEERIGGLGILFSRMEAEGLVPAARLLAVAADRARVERACRELGVSVALAIDNCPHQVVLAGPEDAVEAVAGHLRSQGIYCERLPFARAYHTPEFAPALGPVHDFFAELALSPPKRPLYSCALAGRMPDDPEAIRRLAVEQWARPVAFRETIERMYDDGVRLFVEVGARGNLTGFVEDILRGRPAFAVAANLPRRSGLTQLNHLVAALFAQGIALRPDFLYARRRPVRVDLAGPPRRKATPFALKVGFPAMRLSSELIERLRNPHGPEGRASESSANGFGHHLDARALLFDTGLAPEHSTPLMGEESVDEAMLGYLRTMDDFLETQRRVMAVYLGDGQQGPVGYDPAGAFGTDLIQNVELFDRGPAPVAGTPRETLLGPWVGTVVSLVPGRELVAVRQLDARRDPVAEHHTLGGRRVSVLDPGRKGLPVLPFTVMAEMLAQAAAVLVPGRPVVGFRDVQAHRWIRYEETPIALELRARRDLDRLDEVRVEIANRGPSDAPRLGTEGAVVEGTVVFAAGPPAAPIAPAFELPEPGPCRFTAEELYRDQWLFHGPALRALTRVGWSSPEGIEGTLRVLPRQALLEQPERSGLLTDVIVLDAFTHLLGCWGLDQLVEGYVIFPLRVAWIEFFGDDPPEGTEIACRIQIRERDRHRVRADADLVRPDGRLWVRIEGWEDWRFYWPARYRDVFRQPDRVFVGEPLELAGAPTGVRAVWLEPPADMGRPIWRDVLEWVQLGPDERAALHAQGDHEARRTLRLWGRIAAKEAARRLWIERGGPPIYPADLRIEADAKGCPHLRSLREPDRAEMPAISIAHTEGVALALAALDPNARVGIDVERIVDRSAEFEAIAFSGSERALLNRFEPELRAEWVARFWCAKEAVAKATGIGMIAGSASVEVVAVEPGQGECAMVLGPELASHCPAWSGRSIRVVTARRDDYAWAWTVGQEVER